MQPILQHRGEGWIAMKHSWNVWLSCVVLGLMLVAMMIGIPGCYGFGGCGCGCGSCGTTATTSFTISITTSTAITGSTESTSTSIASSATTKGEILTSEEDADAVFALFTKFLDGTVPPSAKVELVENGEKYIGQLLDLQGSPVAGKTSGHVTSVTFTSGTTANVEYEFLVDGTPAAPKQMGQAVKQGDVWKVSEEDFAQFVVLLQGSSIPSTTAP
jgi:hypothetical protein